MLDLSLFEVLVITLLLIMTVMMFSIKNELLSKRRLDVSYLKPIMSDVASIKKDVTSIKKDVTYIEKRQDTVSVEISDISRKIERSL